MVSFMLHHLSPRLGIFLAGILVLAVAVFHETMLLPDGRLHMHVFDVGQGDAILLVTPSGKQILVDGGPDTSVLEHLGKHMPFFDRTIDMVILSHPHLDHMASLREVLKRYSVDTVMLTGIAYQSGRYTALLEEMSKQNVTPLLAHSENDLDLGDGVILDVLWPIENLLGGEIDNLNNSSIALRVLYKEESILLTGDIELETEKEILARGIDLSSTILKVAHHGSRTSSSTGFLLASTPRFAVISAGRDNKFQHPHPETVERYRSMNIPVQITQDSGTISLVFP